MSSRRQRRPSLPPTRRSFGHRWDEIKYLHAKIAFWYATGDISQARRYIPRLQMRLRAERESHDAILGEICWSFVAEFRNEIPRAVRLLDHALTMMIDWFARNPNYSPFDRRVMSYWFQPAQYRHLAELHMRRGDHQAALRTLTRAREFCASIGLRFGARRLLEKLSGGAPGHRRPRENTRLNRSVARRPKKPRA